MGDYKKAGKKKIEGKKIPVVVYKKTGSSKLYVMRKGRMMSYVSYKKMCAKKLMAKVAKKVSKVRKVRKVRKGGEGCSNNENFSQESKMEEHDNMNDNIEQDISMDGGQKRQQQKRQQQKRQQQKRQQQKRQQQKRQQQKRKQQKRKQQGGNEEVSFTLKKEDILGGKKKSIK